MPSSLVVEVKVAEIRTGRNHERDDAHVKALATSMSEIGLIEPIVLSKDYDLICGYHRLWAARSLEWRTIPAVVFEGEDIHQKMATIDENLVRKALTVAERSELLAERKQLYEALHPETKAGAKGGPGNIKGQRSENADSAVSFTADTASKTGRGRRTIEEEVRIGTRVPRDVMEKVKREPMADSKQLMSALAEFTTEEQRRIAAGKDVEKKLRAEIMKRKESVPLSRRHTKRPSQDRCQHLRLRCERCGKLISQ